MRFEVFGATDTSVIPEGSAICYWEDATFGGDDADPAPDGYRGQFLGWATRDATLFKLYRSRYSLDVAGMAGWLDRFGSFAQTLVNPGHTPTQWHEMQQLTLDKAAHYALRSYSNALTLVNFYSSGVSDEAQSIDLGKRSLWGQIADVVRGYYGVVGCDTLGGLWLRRQYVYLNSAERVGFTPVITLSNADWTDERGLTVTQEKSEAVGLVEANGSRFDGTTTIPLASKAHGQYGVGRVSAPFQFVSQQDQLNSRSGHHLARLNNPRPSVTLKLLGNLDVVEPAWSEPIAISGAGDNVRNLALSGDQFMVTRVSVEHSNEAGKPPKTIMWTLEGVTAGDAALTSDVPAPVIKPPTPPRVRPGRVKKGLISPGTGTIAAPNDDGYVYITRNFSAVTPTWTRYPISGMTGYLMDFVPDPFSPLYLGTGSTVNGWLVTENEIGHLADIFGASPTYTVQHTFATVIGVYDGQRVIETERSTQNFVVVVSYYPGAGTKAIVTTDGSSWGTETTLEQRASLQLSVAGAGGIGQGGEHGLQRGVERIDVSGLPVQRRIVDGDQQPQPQRDGLAGMDTYPLAQQRQLAGVLRREHRRSRTPTNCIGRWGRCAATSRRSSAATAIPAAFRAGSTPARSTTTASCCAGITIRADRPTATPCLPRRIAAIHGR